MTLRDVAEPPPSDGRRGKPRLFRRAASHKPTNLTAQRRPPYTLRMAVPLRQMPVDWESPEAAELDPFRYGWRPKYVRLPNGELDEQRTPLTLEDLLDPQLGDVVTQSDTHFDLMIVLAELLRRHYASRDDVFVAGDLKMLWGIPGIPEPSPDIAVIFGVRKKHDSRRRSFRCKREGTRPSLIIELVSSIDSGTRNNDYEKKVGIYQRVGIPEYFIFDPPSEVTDGAPLADRIPAGCGRTVPGSQSRSPRSPVLRDYEPPLRCGGGRRLSHRSSTSPQARRSRPPVSWTRLGRPPRRGPRPLRGPGSERARAAEAEIARLRRGAGPQKPLVIPPASSSPVLSRTGNGRSPLSVLQCEC